MHTLLSISNADNSLSVLSFGGLKIRWCVPESCGDETHVSDHSAVYIYSLGVRKTAFHEGLASRIVAKEVPEVGSFLIHVIFMDYYSQISAQQARSLNRPLCDHSGIRVQFQDKLKALIRDIEIFLLVISSCT